MIDTIKRISFMRNIRLFNGIDDNQLREIAENFDEIRIAEGEIIFKQEHKAEGFYLIYSGQVSIVKKKNRKDKQTFLFFSGDYFGEKDLLTSTRKRSATSTALCETVLLVFTRGDFRNFLQKFFSNKKFPSINLKERLVTENVVDRIQLAHRLSVNHLVLRSLNLTNIPAEIGTLRSLDTLDISSNKLHGLPSEFEVLTNLRNLYLSNNAFEKVPLQVYKIKNLESLHLSRNNIANLSPQIGKLKELRHLSLQDNLITRLPSEIGQLKNLEVLEIRGNKIVNLPFEILEFNNLKTLDLRENPLPIPPEILENVNEPKNILNYYLDTHIPVDYGDPATGGNFNPEFESVISIFEQRRLKSLLKGWVNLPKPLNEIKLLLVGQGSVGKTSLVQQILHGTFDQNQTKTEGISINQWQVEGSEKRKTEGQSEIENRKSEIRLNIWDFGGQEIMHATHQFFLTKRSLYLLVLDARLTQEENRVEYWLKIIQSFGGESPVLIVGNKIDQHPLDIDRTGLQKKYPNIVGILETSAATGAGIDALKAEIAKQVDTLPHVRDLLPETWFTVKSKLEELGREKNFITQDEYLNLCGANDVADETSQHTLIGFLHDLGVVLHFQDDPRLEALGILNPQWVTNGVYKILNSHELFQNQGTLTLPILNKTLIPPEYPSNKRLFIVDMMKKFELCYDIEPDNSFLIPDLLPKDEPYTGEWDGALAFQYHYNVLPTSIISRFIVRLNAFIYKTVWRSGVVLKSGGNTALVKADTEDRKIFIWVSGDEPTRRDFLSAIRMEFSAIHKTIVKIEVAEKVPHPDYPDLVLDYEELIAHERENISTFTRKVSNKIVTVNVKSLLAGVEGGKSADVFVSYSHADAKFVKKLVGDLKDEGILIWQDAISLEGGDVWADEMERGLLQCKICLVVLSPDSVDSKWVKKEYTFAETMRKTIVPVRYKECDLPFLLNNIQYVDFAKQEYKKGLAELVARLKKTK